MFQLSFHEKVKAAPVNILFWLPVLNERTDRLSWLVTSDWEQQSILDKKFVEMYDSAAAPVMKTDYADNKRTVGPW